MSKSIASSKKPSKSPSKSSSKTPSKSSSKTSKKTSSRTVKIPNKSMISQTKTTKKITKVKSINLSSESPIRSESPIKSKTESPIESKTESPIESKTETPIRSETESPIKSKISSKSKSKTNTKTSTKSGSDTKPKQNSKSKSKAANPNIKPSPQEKKSNNIDKKIAEKMAALQDNYAQQQKLNAELKELIALHKKNISISANAEGRRSSNAVTNKPEPVPEALIELFEIDDKNLPRSVVTTLFYKYLKDNKLYDTKTNKQIVPDDKLIEIFGIKKGETMDFYNIQKWLNKLYE